MIAPQRADGDANAAITRGGQGNANPFYLVPNLDHLNGRGASARLVRRKKTLSHGFGSGRKNALLVRQHQRDCRRRHRLSGIDCRSRLRKCVRREAACHTCQQRQEPA